MKIENIRNSQVVTVEKSDVMHAGQHGSRLFVIVDHPADEHGKKLCLTRWDDSSEWECSREFTGDDWTGIDDDMVAEVVGKPFVLRRMIRSY